jgi:hypothetical protein
MLRVQRRLVAVAAISVAGATISIGLSWLLMPHLGSMGAGWAALASPMIVATTLTAIVCHRSFAGTRTAGSASATGADIADKPAMELS